MNNQNYKSFNKAMKQGISLAIKIKDQYDKSKNNPIDNSALQSSFANELYVDGGVVKIRWDLLYQRVVKGKVYIDWQSI